MAHPRLHRTCLTALAALLLTVLLAGVASAELSPSPPLSAQGDTALAALASSGTGTASDPYVIRDLQIVATGATGILLKDTTAHVLIQGCKVANGGSRFSGIRLENARNVVVDGVVLEGNKNGIDLVNSRDVVVRGSRINSTVVGVYLDGSTGVAVRDNELPQNERNVHLRKSTGNTFEGNRLSVANRQTGFHFEDEQSYDNLVRTNNTVNGVAVRWYTRVSAPLTVADARVEVKGITNVAQVMVWRSEGVTLLDPVARDGTARGILVMESTDVRVVAPVVKGNGGSGVVVTKSADVRVVGGNMSLNGDVGVHFLDNTGATRLESSNVTENRGRGVVAKGAGATTVAKTLVLANRGDGVLLDRTGGSSSVSSNTVRANTGTGIHLLDVGASTTASANTVHANGGKGILLTRPGTGAVVSANDVRGNVEEGIGLVHARRGAVVAANTVVHHPRGLHLQESSRNALWSNVVTTRAGEIGVHLQDTFSYDNAAPTNNTVNGVALQWHAGATGTASSPLAFENVRSELKGVLNVAQILFHNATHVVIRDPVAANGTGVGLLLHQTSHARVLGATARENAGAGVVVAAPTNPGAKASNVEIADARATSNGGDAGIVLRGLGVEGATVRGAEVTSNRGAGIRLEQTGAGVVVRNNTLSRNADEGIVLDRAALAVVRGNVVERSARAVVLTGSTTNVLEENRLTLSADGYGLFFRDEQSYNNRVATNNTVNGVRVQWHTYTSGREGEPVLLPDLRVDLRGITNVAQIMLYKTEHVVLDRAVAASGVERGIYVHTSSNVKVTNATVSGSPVGIALAQTLSSVLDANTVSAGEVAVRLERSSGNTVARTTVRSGAEGVVLLESDRNRVSLTDASGASARSVRDPSFVAGKPNAGANLVVDAGLDRRILLGGTVTFADAIGVSPFRDERVVAQFWDFGVGPRRAETGADALRPTVGYNRTGDFVVRYWIETTGQSYHDTVTVKVVAPLGAPQRLRATPDAERVLLVWNPPLDEGLTAVTLYKVWRAEEAGEATLLGTTNLTSYVDSAVRPGRNYTYAVSAMNLQGEGPRSATAAVRTLAPDAPPPPSEPRSLVATLAEEGGVTLAWTPPLRAGPGVLYLVLRAEGDGDESLLLETRNTTYRDALAAPGRAYRYSVQAKDANGTGPPTPEAAIEVPPVEVRFSDATPEADATVAPRPEVSLAYATDPPTAVRVVLRLEGEEVAASSGASGTLAWAPPSNLKAGTHVLTATAWLGDVPLATHTWEVLVSHPRIVCPAEVLAKASGDIVAVRCRVEGAGGPGGFDVEIRQGPRLLTTKTLRVEPGATEPLLFTHELQGAETTLRVGPDATVLVRVGETEDAEEEKESPAVWPFATLAVAAWVRRRRLRPA